MNLCELEARLTRGMARAMKAEATSRSERQSEEDERHRTNLVRRSIELNQELEAAKKATAVERARFESTLSPLGRRIAAALVAR